VESLGYQHKLAPAELAPVLKPVGAKLWQVVRLFGFGFCFDVAMGQSRDISWVTNKPTRLLNAPRWPSNAVALTPRTSLWTMSAWSRRQSKMCAISQLLEPRRALVSVPASSLLSSYY
jgi:hypothetical protein